MLNGLNTHDKQNILDGLKDNYKDQRNRLRGWKSEKISEYTTEYQLQLFKQFHAMWDVISDNKINLSSGGSIMNNFVM